MGNAYIVDPTDAAEGARLRRLAKLLSQESGGPLSEQSPSQDFSHILDLGCGSGGWVLEVAKNYPDTEVTGVDIDITLLSTAQSFALKDNLQKRVRFVHMDLLKDSLPFPNHSFDLTNISLLSLVVRPEQWAQLLQECRRITRPGGVIRLTEWEFTLTNSPALVQLEQCCLRALQLAGRSFSDTQSLTTGVTPKLSTLLQSAGCETNQKHSFQIDFSTGSRAHEDMYQNALVFFRLVQPFLLEQGVTTKEEVDRLYTQGLVEMRFEDFHGIGQVGVIWGHTPGEKPARKRKRSLAV